MPVRTASRGAVFSEEYGRYALGSGFNRGVPKRGNPGAGVAWSKQQCEAVGLLYSGVQS
jgi:hypothetical protein